MKNFEFKENNVLYFSEENIFANSLTIKTKKIVFAIFYKKLHEK